MGAGVAVTFLLLFAVFVLSCLSAASFLRQLSNVRFGSRPLLGSISLIALATAGFTELGKGTYADNATAVVALYLFSWGALAESIGILVQRKVVAAFIGATFAVIVAFLLVLFNVSTN